MKFVNPYPIFVPHYSVMIRPFPIHPSKFPNWAIEAILRAITQPLSLPPEFLPPDYQGGSIANVPATIAAMLQVPFAGLPPLPGSLWRPLGNDIRRVVIITLDALGQNLLDQEAERLQPYLAETAVRGQLTSIFPSTTVAALSSLWTGTAPAQHGLAALYLLFPEYGTIGQMLNFSPIFAEYPNALVNAGLKPEEYLAVPGLAQQLATGGIPTYAFKGAAIVKSALSQMHGRGVADSFGAWSMADMMVEVGRFLEEKAGEPLFVSAYWPSIDAISHMRGWNGAQTAAEFHMLWQQIHQTLRQKLSRAARHHTALFIVADHGQTLCPRTNHIHLSDHPELNEMLLMRPAGEPRVAYLYAKQGRVQDIVNYVNENMNQAALAVPTAQALAAGLFGPPPYAAQIDNRLGDVVLLMRHNYLFVHPEDKSLIERLYGWHGGMTHAEMSVPWLGFRLDD
jgi:hypothetical protein